MATLAQLHQAVSSAVAAKRVGKPLFVRYHLQGVLSAEGTGIVPSLATVAATVGAWMGQPAEKLHRLTAAKDPKTVSALTLRYPDGASAIVSAAHGTKGLPGVSFIMLGSRGALYHAYEGGTLHAWEQPARSLDLNGNVEILAAIEEALKQGTDLVPVRKPEKPAPPLPPNPPEKGKPRYGVLLVTGSHTHQENYAAAFAADPRAQLIALTDEKDIDARRRRLNERLARALNVPYIADLDESLKRADVHVVSICAEPERRGRIAVRCAAAGKHLYLDKSLVPALAEADALRAAVNKAKVKSHLFCFISQSWAGEAKKLLDSGKLGTLLAIHADCFFAKGKVGTATLGTPRKEEYPPRRHQLIEAKRELDNVGVYPITLVQWLTGKKFKSVYGMTGNYFFAEHQKHDVEDFGLLSCTLEDGLPVTIAAGRCGWTSHPSGGVNQMLLVGSEGTALIDANRPRLEIANDDTPWTPPNVNPEDPMGFWSSTMAAVHLRPKTAWAPLPSPVKSDAAYFLDRLDAGQDSEMPVSEAAAATEVLLAAYLSASKGEVVRLPLAR